MDCFRKSKQRDFKIKKLQCFIEAFCLSTLGGNRTHTPKNTSLSRARLPIPPPRHIKKTIKTFILMFESANVIIFLKKHNKILEKLLSELKFISKFAAQLHSTTLINY
jgi:hypothetical protein